MYRNFFVFLALGGQGTGREGGPKPAILSGQYQGEERHFYESKVLTMRFFFAYEMPKTLGLECRLMDSNALTVAMEEALLG